MRNGINILIVLICVLAHSSEYNAQQDWMYTQSSFNLYDANGAYAGSYKEASFAGRYRYQWTGIEGAPKSTWLSFHMPVFQNVGVGVRLLNESIGARKRQKAKGTVAYKLPLKKGYLGLAFNGGIVSHQYDIDKLNSKNDLSTILNPDNRNGSGVIFDFSALWYSKQFYLGMEVQNINEPSFFPGEFIDMKQQRFFHFMGAYAISLNDNTVLRASSSYRYVKGIEGSAEVQLGVFLDHRFWIGGGYRYNYGILAFFEWNVSEQFRFGYSYDHGLDPLGVLSQSSHELFLGYRIQKEKSKGRSIRYFK